VSTEQQSLEQIYRDEWGRIVATLIRLLGSFELAEEAAQEAFAVALEQWPRQGTPANARAWLIATARHKAIDALRRKTRWEDSREVDALAALAAVPEFSKEEDGMAVEDDRLRLIFTCCHPALNREAQVALTLRTLCGLTTEQIARAFLAPLPTMAQRLVRARQKIRDAGIPYRTPPRAELRERLEAVLLVVYLVFNEGYNAAGEGRALSEEAIRLGRVLCELLPAEAEVRGLLALMLLHDARRARTVFGAGGDCGGACAGGESGRDGLGADCRALRCAVAHAAVAGGGAESRGRGGDGRGVCGGVAVAGCVGRARGVARVLPVAGGAGGFVAAAGTVGRGGGGVSRGA
jgi:RNA polymerase sigma-70 factor, ECF subfamily